MDLVERDNHRVVPLQQRVRLGVHVVGDLGADPLVLRRSGQALELLGRGAAKR